METATRMEIERWGFAASEARVAAAFNLARRMDKDPTNGATHSREWRLLLDQLPGTRREPDALDENKARYILVHAGWTLIKPDGEPR